ncbi:MAG: PqqD family protein [Chloroflexota bacterium]
MTLESRPLCHPEVVGRVVEDEAVIVLPEKGQVKVLNAVGARIWSLLDGSRRVREVVEELCNEYDVTHAEMESDALAFLTELLEEGAIVLSSEEIPES